jgi:hypothetical protein
MGMPQISIRERFLPFSHTPGISLLFPGSSLKFQIYPTLIKIQDLLGEVEEEISLPLEGAVSGFTVVQDLEKGAILVFGKDARGFFRFKCQRESEDLFLIQDKGAEGRWELPRPKVLGHPPSTNERLSVVSYRKRSWERVVEKGDWVHQLSTLYRFLVWYEKAKNPIEGEIKDLVLGGFEGLLVPTGKDTKRLGYSLSFPDPMAFLQGLRTKIEAFFVKEENDLISLCPALPQELPSGRLKGVLLDGFRCDLEWRKKIVRRAALTTEKEKTLRLEAKGLSSVHIERKNINLLKPIFLPANQSFFLDKFLKEQ